MLDSAFTLDAQLYYAEQYLNDQDGFDNVISEAISYEKSGYSTDLSSYIQDQLHSKPGGQVISSGGDVRLQTFSDAGDGKVVN